MPQLTELYRIDHYIDTFALGHYARVMESLDRRTGRTVAFKVMRPEHLMDDGDLRWEYRAFANEAEILMALADSPQVVNLTDCGFVATGDEAPVQGEIESFQQDVRGFARALTDFSERGWRPYLALQNMPRAENLFYLMKPDKQSVRRRLPTEEGLALALQFANLLQLAHQQHIVYLDHKMEHVYWDGSHLTVIDFNSSQQLRGGATDDQQRIRDIHNLCVGILYPVFTGLSPQKSSLRPQPGGMDVVESRYQDVNELDFAVEPTLSSALQDLLSRGARMEIQGVDEFIAELQQVGSLHGWDFPHTSTSPASRDARGQMRAGLRRLREGETRMREARDLFREALILDDITDDLEDELRRLVKSVNDMLNQRVIP